MRNNAANSHRELILGHRALGSPRSSGTCSNFVADSSVKASLLKTKASFSTRPKLEFGGIPGHTIRGMISDFGMA